MLKISVVIPLYNEENNILFCLEHLLNQKALPYQIILVDNLSTDKSVEKIQLFMQNHPQLNIILLTEPKRGVGPARNKGLANADGEIIAFTNADCLVRQDWIERTIELYETEEIDGIGGIAYLYNPRTLSEKFEALDLAVSRQMLKSVIEKKYEPVFGKFILHLNASYKRKVFEQVGALDETFFCEDIDFSIRAFEKGFRLVAWHPELVVWHMPDKKIGSYLRKIFRYSIPLPRLVAKHFPKTLLLELPVLGIKRLPFFSSAVITSEFLMHMFYFILILIFYKFIIIILPLLAVALFIKSVISAFSRGALIDRRFLHLDLFKIAVIDFARKATLTYGKIYASIKNRLIYL